MARRNKYRYMDEVKKNKIIESNLNGFIILYDKFVVRYSTAAKNIAIADCAEQPVEAKYFTHEKAAQKFVEKCNLIQPSEYKVIKASDYIIMVHCYNKYNNHIESKYMFRKELDTSPNWFINMEDARKHMVKELKEQQIEEENKIKGSRFKDKTLEELHKEFAEVNKQKDYYDRLYTEYSEYFKAIATKEELIKKEMAVNPNSLDFLTQEEPKPF